MIHRIINYRNSLPETTEPWLSLMVGSVNNNTIQLRTMNNTIAAWYSHDLGDEFFMVLEGEIVIETSANRYQLKEKECLVVPAGIKHRALSEGLSKVLVIDNFK